MPNEPNDVTERREDRVDNELGAQRRRDNYQTAEEQHKGVLLERQMTAYEDLETWTHKEDEAQDALDRRMGGIQDEHYQTRKQAESVHFKTQTQQVRSALRSAAEDKTDDELRASVIRQKLQASYQEGPVVEALENGYTVGAPEILRDRVAVYTAQGHVQIDRDLTLKHGFVDAHGEAILDPKKTVHRQEYDAARAGIEWEVSMPQNQELVAGLEDNYSKEDLRDVFYKGSRNGTLIFQAKGPNVADLMGGDDDMDMDGDGSLDDLF